MIQKSQNYLQFKFKNFNDNDDQLRSSMLWRDGHHR